MGHIRLGNLPRSKKWGQVVDLIGGGATTAEIAAATMDAAQRGFTQAAKDPGLVYSFWLLTQIPLAARGEHFPVGLREIGLQVSDSPSLPEIIGAFTEAVDSHLRERCIRSDLGEMAQMAASESLTALGTERTNSLFETTADDVQQAFRKFSTTNQFGVLARDFFSRLSNRYLNYFLSRELSNHVGGDGRFTNIDDHTEFNRALRLHCQQAARIVETFAGGWLSKTSYFEGEITPEKASGFVHVALKKLRAELAAGAR
jgi:hypothetical protein